MARPATGGVVEHTGKDGKVYRSLRYRAYGHRYTQPLGAVSRAKAEQELSFVMADIARGAWEPPRPTEAPPERPPTPTFHEYAEEWWTLREGEWRPKTHADYRWRLECHLLPAFGEMPLDQIKYDAIERYIASKLAEEDGLSPRSVNMTITLLGAILERARKRGLIDHNPAKDSDLRVKEREPMRSYLDDASQIEALLDAAGELDRAARKGRRHVERRAMLAVLVFAGLRIGELCALRWRDVDLAGGWLHTGSKTDAGRRRVKIRGALRDELLSLRGRHQTAAQVDYVFPTATGAMQSQDNFRSRVLGKATTVQGGETIAGNGAIALANERREAEGLPPLPDKLTPHSLRRTFCSLLYALGEDPGTVMDEMGHTDPALALRVYRQAMRRNKDEKQLLSDLVDGSHWANTGERGALDVEDGVHAAAV